MSDLLFVYGTLRRLSRHPMAQLLAEQACFIGQGTVAGRLYNLGRYPGMTEAASKADRVVGDVYRLADEDTIRELDEYESAESPLPSYFERGLAEVVLTDARQVQAMVYWFRGQVDETQRILSGDYREILDISCSRIRENAG
jgi:gamma-glutamylcyclotransferase (GGCT)/AIG2-like uncharacterized protein YtfP